MYPPQWPQAPLGPLRPLGEVSVNRAVSHCGDGVCVIVCEWGGGGKEGVGVVSIFSSRRLTPHISVPPSHQTPCITLHCCILPLDGNLLMHNTHLSLSSVIKKSQTDLYVILSHHFWIITTMLVASKREPEGEPLCIISPKTDPESGLDHLLDSKHTCFHHRRAPVQHAAGDRGRLMYSLLPLFLCTLIITTLKWTKVLGKNKTRRDEIYLPRFFSPLGIFTWPMKNCNCDCNY